MVLQHGKIKWSSQITMWKTTLQIQFPNIFSLNLLLYSYFAVIVKWWDCLPIFSEIRLSPEHWQINPRMGFKITNNNHKTCRPLKWVCQILSPSIQEHFLKTENCAVSQTKSHCNIFACMNSDLLELPLQGVNLGL